MIISKEVLKRDKYYDQQLLELNYSTEEEDEEVTIHPDPELEDAADKLVEILFGYKDEGTTENIDVELGKVIDKESGDEFLLDGCACTNYIDMKKHNKEINIQCTGNFALVAFHYDIKDGNAIWLSEYEIVDINQDKIISDHDMVRLSISNILEDSTIRINGELFNLPKHEEPKEEEVNLEGFYIGSNLDEEQEPDYSNYEPTDEEVQEEEQPEEERVSFSEFKERRHKKHKDMKFKDNNEDMDEY